MMAENHASFMFNQENPERLDKYLVSQLSDYSRARIQSLISSGCITVNGNIPKKSGQALVPGDEIEVTIPEVTQSELIPEAVPLDIIYEDGLIIVINKPADMVVHPSAGHASGTLIHAVLAHAPELNGIGGVARPGVVHRLDKDTSGLIIIAKDDKTHRWLQDQFKLRKVHKVYTALVDGHPPTTRGRIEAAIGRDAQDRKKMSVYPQGKSRESITEYTEIKRFLKHTLIEAHPLTGRTHQIRVHMSFLGCPIAGDTIYGYRKSSIPTKRHFLHASKLSILLPGNAEETIFEAPLPDELQQIIAQLK